MNTEMHVLDHEPHVPEHSYYYRMRLTPGAHSARHIRRILRVHLAAWGFSELTEAAELGATELLANVVKHVPDSVCTVLLRRRETGVRVEVHDNDPALPTLRRAGELDESGRGLALLDACTNAWDAERTGPRTKVVWFELRAGERWRGDGMAPRPAAR